MSSLNKVQLIGNVGKDPVTKTLESGAKVCEFSLATTEKYDGKEQTEWHTIIAWNKTADLIEKYVNKGDKIYIEGKIKTRKWEADGGTRFFTEIIAFSVIFLGGKRPAEPPEGINADEITDEPPF